MGGLGVDADFTKTMGIKMLQGRDFEGTPADSVSMIVAEINSIEITN